MRFILFFIILNFIVSCGAHLPVDIYPNHAEYGYHSLEFDISKKNGFVKKELGIANIFINNEEDFYNTDIYIYGIYKGSLNFFSSACGIDLKINFEGTKKFKLSELVSEPRKCSIKITSVTDKIGSKENLIIETGIIKINTANKENKPLEIYYTRNDSNLGLKKYSFLGQGSLQRVEGPLSSFEDVTINSNLKTGGLYRVVGCGNELIGDFKESEFELNLSDFFKKDILSREDTCDLEIIVIPNSEEFSYMARFSINIYGKEVVKLENLNWTIEGNNLLVTGNSYVAICSINEYFSFKKNTRKNITCKQKYDSEKIYWVRGITSNGRKSIFAIKNKKLIWYY